MAEVVTREFTNELGNAIRITIEGPTSTSENILTPMEVVSLRGALDEHAALSSTTTERSDGWKLVPPVPTEAMVRAAAGAPESSDAKQDIENMWTAMLDAVVSVGIQEYRVSAGAATGWSPWFSGDGKQFEKSYQVERRLSAPPPAGAQQAVAISPEQAFETHKCKVSPFSTSYPIFLAGWNAALAAPAAAQGASQHTYASTQATNCAGCGQHKHTPLRIDAMGGYVCLTCIDQKLGSLLGEFGYPEAAPTTDQRPEGHLHSIAGLGRMTDEDGGFITLQFVDETSAQAFMNDYACAIEIDDMPPIEAAPSAKEGEAPMLLATAPEHIWLDLGDDFDGDPATTAFHELGDVTWSKDNASGKGIKYVRVGIEGLTPAGSPD